MVILSGPEPERTSFLNESIKNATKLGDKVAFVGAVISDYDSFPNPKTEELSLLIAQSDTVYSRAGYTTIMEMVGLDKKALLFPTKGQYEQEYLAKYVSAANITFA